MGYKHEDKTLEFFRNDRKVSEETRKNLSSAATGRILTEEDRKKISDARSGIKLSDETRKKISAAAIELRGVPVVVKNKDTGEISVYESLTEAAEVLKVSRPTVKKYLDSDKALKQKFILTTKNK